jgi:hypothetical protein
MGPKTGQDGMERKKIMPLPGLELRPLGRPARTRSLYRLRYPDETKRVNRHTYLVRMKKTEFWRKNM